MAATNSLSYLTRRAYLPFLLIFMASAMTEFCGSRIMTSPEKSSLRLVALQLGQAGSAVIELHSRQAFSLMF